MKPNLQDIIDEASEWLKYEGVEGVAQGEKEGKACILVLASCPPTQLSEMIPKHFKGFPVVINETGTLNIQ